MGTAIDCISGFVLNPSTTATAITNATGETNVVKYFAAPDKANLITLWSPGATAGIVRVRSPRLHDFAQGIRCQRSAGQGNALIPLHGLQPLYPADPLTIEITGGASETDMAALLVYYDNLPGIQARLSDWPTIQPHIRNLLGVEVDPTAGATAGTYGSTRAINADFDTLKANTDYAILGANVSVAVGVCSLVGPDLGNLDVPFPGITDADFLRAWFVLLSQHSGKPCIPIISGTNKSVTLIKVADVAASTAVKVTLVMAELGP